MSATTVDSVLQNLPKDKPVYYRANPGNAGDALIASGAYKKFRQAGLKIQLILDPNNFDAKGKTVIYAGGGNLVGIYPEARDFFYQHHKTAENIILLPHTIAKNEDLLAALGANTILFAREQVSYDHIRKHAINANTFIDHDLALCLDPREILAHTPIGFFPALIKKCVFKALGSSASLEVPQIKKMFSNTIFELRNTAEKLGHEGYFFREDVEASGRPTPPNNADLSQIYEYGTKNQSLTDYTTWRLLRYIDKFHIVNTDRLHICIAALLLDKKVNFYPNSYFKCKAVYEFSLKSQFKNLNWVGQ